jgi:hypothetical protein
MKRALVAAVAFLALASGAGAKAATAVSSNWAGYAVSGTTYRSVSGTWTQPAASCASATSSQTASAFWVGLGGDSEASNALEQTGTEADCAVNGLATYSAWYELVPAASAKAPLKISAGDRISASVQVAGTSVTVKLRDLTTGRGFTKTLRMAAPDVSSAEWIAEAPSTITPVGTTILPLTDFGTVRFTSATATTTSARTGTISDSAWSPIRIDLVSAGGGPGPGRGFGPFAPAAGGIEAVASRLAAGGSAFSIAWSQTG